MQSQMESLIGSYGWMFIAGFAILLFRSVIESSVESFKVFWAGTAFDKLQEMVAKHPEFLDGVNILDDNTLLPPSSSSDISPNTSYLYLIASGASFLTSKTLNLFSSVTCSLDSVFFLSII